MNSYTRPVALDDLDCETQEPKGWLYRPFLYTACGHGGDDPLAEQRSLHTITIHKT